MTTHLTSHEIAAAVAGLELTPQAREHLASCLGCRAEVTDLERLIDLRRVEIAAGQPDWESQAQRLMDRLPATGDSGRAPTRWWRTALAAAAVVVVAVGVGVLHHRRPVAQPAAAPSVEEILAEMDQLLADDTIPGFEVIDPGLEELETFIDNGAS
jgi:hypothetical protein